MVIKIGDKTPPIPINIPIADMTHINDAVVNPYILSSTLITTPAPRNPIPVNMVDIILLGSDNLHISDNITEHAVNSAVPTHIKIFVLSPATLSLSSLSYPMMPPQIVAVNIFGNRNNNT